MNKKFFNCLLFSMGIVSILLASCTQRTLSTSPMVMTGKASWYGPQFHGKVTSSKEIYNMYDMTAAHKTLPFGTYVMVTNLKNGRSVRVKINDRGPFIRGRILDLSYAAARALDMVGPGVVPVRIEVLSDISWDLNEPRFAVQVGAFVNKKNALALKSKLREQYQNVYVSEFKTSQSIYHRVRLGFASRDKALDTARELQRQGYEVFLVEDQVDMLSRVLVYLGGSCKRQNLFFIEIS